MGNTCTANTTVHSTPEVSSAVLSQSMPPITRETKLQELKSVLEADKTKPEEGDRWYVVEAAWVRRWLAYVQGDETAKEPGIIRNSLLLRYDPEKKQWSPKPLLRAARREHMGHYRRVNARVWSIWSDLYQGSGPAIWSDTAPYENSANWTIDPNYDLGKGPTVDVDGDGSKDEPKDPNRLWPSTSRKLAIGEMEDEGIGDETKAQAAAFFDTPLNISQQSNGTPSGLNTSEKACGEDEAKQESVMPPTSPITSSSPSQRTGGNAGGTPSSTPAETWFGME